MGRCATCLESTLLDRLQITPEDLRRSWVEAQRGQAFGDIVDRATFADPRAWARVVGDVREGLGAARGVYNGASKLAPRIYDAVVALGEQSDEAAVTATLGPVFRDLVLETQKDPELQLLRSRPPVLERIFGDGEAFAGMMATAKDRIVEAISARPPPAETPHSLEQIEQSALSAAQGAFERATVPAAGTAAAAAFGALGHDVVYPSYAPQTGGAVGAAKATAAAAGGAVVAALVWLRDSLLFVIGQMWRFVRKFSLLLVMLAAVILAYCALLGRQFKVDGKSTEYAADAQGVHNLQDYANVAMRTYDADLCGMLWWGIDMLTQELPKETAEGVDRLFSKAVTAMTEADQAGLAQGLLLNTHAFIGQGANESTLLARLSTVFSDTGDNSGRTFADVNAATARKIVKDDPKTGYARHAWNWVKDATYGTWQFVSLSSASNKFAAKAHEAFPKELEAANKFVALVEAHEANNASGAKAKGLQSLDDFVKANKGDIDGFYGRMFPGSGDLEKLDGSALKAQLEKKFNAGGIGIGGLLQADAQETNLQVLKQASRLLQRQCIGASVFVSRAGGIPGLQNFGDFLGINNVGVQDRGKATAVLTMLVVIGYFVSPAFMLGLLFAVAAGAVAFTQGQLQPTESIGIAVTVLIAVMHMIPMSDDQSEYIKAVSGMVLDTSKQIQGIQMQRLAAENAITAQRNAMLAQVGGGLAGAAGGFFAGPAGAATAYNLASTVAGSALNASLEHQKLLQQRRGYFGARRGPYGASRFV